MEKLIKNSKHHSILILIMALCHTELCTAGLGSPSLTLPQGRKYTSEKARPDTAPKLPAYCLAINGAIINLLGKIPSIVELKTDTTTNTPYEQVFELSQFHKNPSTDIVGKRPSGHGNYKLLYIQKCRFRC